MRRSIVCIAFLLSIISAMVNAQEPLTNETVVKLVKAGIGDDTIVGMVNQQQGKYALSANDIIALKNGGVSDKIMSAMIVRNGASKVQPTSDVATRVKSSSELVPSSAVANDPTPTVATSATDGRTRVFVTDSQSWEIRGGWSAAGNNRSWGGSGYQAGGARPQTAEIIKTFNQRCPAVTITNNVQRADFAVTLDHEGGKGYARRHNKIVVFNREGDAIFSDSTRALGNSVKDACEAILGNAPPQRRTTAGASNGSAPTANTFTPIAAAVSTSPLPTVSPAPAPANGLINIAFTSTPANALVTIGGMAIGRTPFTTKLPPGFYKATFSVAGFASSIEDITVGPGYPTTVSATLQSSGGQ
jgi:hypothetical protein